jgi:hypothetical protein
MKGLGFVGHVDFPSEEAGGRRCEPAWCSREGWNGKTCNFKSAAVFWAS